jgi:cardiolipin synthase
LAWRGSSWQLEQETDHVLNELFLRHWVTVHGLMVLAGLTVYTIASHTLRQRRHPSAAIAWLISLVLLPYVALPLYLLIGSRKVVSSRAARVAPVPCVAPPATRFGQLAAAMGLPDAVAFEQLCIHQDGTQALQALRGMLDSAERTLELCTFILGRDALGDEISLRLMACARRGVKVRLLIDGIGFYMGGHPNLKRLRLAGVQVTLFVSPLRSALRGRTNLRNHRKLVIVDGRWLWCGGRNLAAEYFEGDPARPRRQPWVDLTFDVQGALVQQGLLRFEQDWVFATTGALARTLRHAAPVARPPETGARLIASGPDQQDDTLFTLLVSGCFTARARVLAVTPYLVPEPTLLMALTLAARRGVAVDLLLPRKSNHVLADIARQAGMRELAAAGARIWLAPGMVHAKAVLIDDGLALVGSANLDERSLFLNYELMVAFQEPAVVQDLARWIDLQRGCATLYRARTPGLVRELAEGLVRWLAFQL